MIDHLTICIIKMALPIPFRSFASTSRKQGREGGGVHGAPFGVDDVEKRSVLSRLGLPESGPWGNENVVLCMDCRNLHSPKLLLLLRLLLLLLLQPPLAPSLRTEG